MLLRRLLSHVRGENWFAVVLDLFVVVVGLFLGLQIDNWWQAHKDAKLESTYLVEIREDFELNKSQLQISTAALEKLIRDMIALLEQSALAEPGMTAAELNALFSSIQSMPTFIPISRAYSNLTGSGDLKLIRSRELKNALADYYAMAQLSQLVQNTHEMELVQTFQPYIIDHLDYLAVAATSIDDFPIPPSLEEARILEVIHARQFRNMVVQKWVIGTDLLGQHRKMLERTNQVLTLLK